jgi:cytochrome P450
MTDDRAVQDAFSRLFLTSGSVEDPYPWYELLRDGGPVVRIDQHTWVLTGYEDCVRVLRDQRFVNDVEAVAVAKGGADWMAHPSVVMLTRMLLVANPPRHSRLRQTVNWSFAANRVTALTPVVDRAVDSLLANLLDERETDFVTAFADVLPMRVIHHLLGIDEQDSVDLRELTRTFNALFERGMTAEQLRAADLAVDAITGYVTELLARKRRRPGPDLASDLVRAADAGGLEHAELVSLVFQIYNASYQTTMSLLGNGLHLLLRHPEQFRRLRRDPSLAPSAVEELLRHDPPVQSTGRHAAVDLDLGGQRIGRGDIAIVVIAAANRDPRRYPDPHRLDIGRGGPGSLSFGYGPHYCLGAAIANAQGAAAFTALARRDVHIELAGTPQRLASSNMRGLASLPVSVSHRSRTTSPVGS